MKHFYISLLCFTLCAVVNAQISTDSLILHLPMNGDANDISGNGNHGTLYNVVPDTNRFGVPDLAYRFNGTDSYIEIPASPSMNMIQTVDEVSISAWININQWHISGNVFSIFERYNPNTDSGWLLEANWVGGGILFLADESNMNNWIGCSNELSFDQWYHLAFTYSQAQQTAKFYVDGVNVCTSAYAPEINVADTTASFYIGRSLAGPDEYSDGLIDDYKIYYRVVTPEEIEGEFELGHSEIDASNGLELFPNPVKDQLTIRTTRRYHAAGYTLVDLTGKTVLTGRISETINTIDLDELAAGIYLFGIDGEPATLRRIVVQ